MQMIGLSSLQQQDFRLLAVLTVNLQLIQMVDRIPVVREREKEHGPGECVGDFHADGLFDQMLLLFLLNSLGFCEGQGQSNSHQLFWFLSEIAVPSGSRFYINQRDKWLRA